MCGIIENSESSYFDEIFQNIEFDLIITNVKAIESNEEENTIYTKYSKYKRRNIKIEGIDITKSNVEKLVTIIKKIKPKSLFFERCLFKYFDFRGALYEPLEILSVTNCNLTFYEARRIFGSLDPGQHYSIDFSNNNIGLNGEKFYEENISDIIGYYDISPLILRNNGFTDEIISKFRKALIQYDEEEYVIFK